MNVITTERRYTPEDLLTLPDADSYELVDGHLVERNMGGKASWIGGRLAHFLATFCDAHGHGLVFPADASYQCFRDAPAKVRKPDVSFIRRERMSPDRIPQGHLSLAPDLAVEVISPNDSYYEVEAKIREYLGAGVRLVWVINPDSRLVRVHRPIGPE